MQDVLSHLPSFISDAITTPETWGFWDWVGYLGALIAIVAFIYKIVRLLGRWVMFLLFRMFIRTTKFQLRMAFSQIISLRQDVNEAFSWSSKPYRLTARCFRTVAVALVYFCSGVLSFLAMPAPLSDLLGAPLIGISILGFITLYQRLLLGVDCTRYVEKIEKQIEKNLKPTGHILPDDPDFKGLIADMNSEMEEIKNIAKQIDERNVPDLPSLPKPEK